MSKKRTRKREEDATGEGHERPDTSGGDASKTSGKKATRSGHWTPELIDAAFQIQELRERVRSRDTWAAGLLDLEASGRH